MKRWLIFSLVACLTGCGGGGGGSATGSGNADSKPVISNLQYSPNVALQFASGGTQIVTGSIDFADAGKDLATIDLTSTDGSNITSPVQGAAGLASGTIQAWLQVDTSKIGKFNFQVSAIDNAGLRSNSLSGTFEVKANDTGSSWTQRSLGVSSGSSFWQKRVRWSGSMFISVGAGIFTSQDGITWTQREPNITTSLNDVIWIGGQFIAVGDGGAVITSPDGISWTSRSIPSVASPTLNGVTGSSSHLVAVGTQIDQTSGNTVTLVLTSPDGINWAVVPLTVQAALNAVVWSGSQFVAVGTALGQSNAQPLTLASADGTNWTSTQLIITGLSTLYDVAWSGSRYVAVGYAGAVTSTDGANWQQTGQGVVSGNYAVGWSGQRFMICGLTYCQTSVDGIQWQSAAMLPGLGPLVYGLAWNGSQWVVVGTSSYVATSP
jgi:hypothetical protein